MSLSAGGPSRSLFCPHQRSSWPKWSDSKHEKSVCVWRGGGGGPIQICLIGFDSHNYRVIMAFSTRPCRSERQLLRTPACCQMVYSRERATERGEREMGGIGNGLWLSSGYWVFDRTPGGQGSNNDRINGQGTMRMSAQREAAVAFELPSDASVIVLSTTLWKGLTCLLVDLVLNAFLQAIVFIIAQYPGAVSEWGTNVMRSWSSGHILLMCTYTVK